MPYSVKSRPVVTVSVYHIVFGNRVQLRDHSHFRFLFRNDLN